MRTTSNVAPEIKQRVLAAIRTEPAATRRAVRRRDGLVLGICVAIALAIFVGFGGLRRYDRPVLLVAWSCVGWAIASGAAVWIGVTRDRSMLARSSAALITLIVATPLALLAWKIGVTTPFGPQMMATWPSRGGLRCLGLSLAMALPLLAGCIVIRRRSDPVHPGLAGAALGMMAGVASGTLVDLWCPVAYLPHLMLGHILPIFVVALAGAWAGRRFLGL